MDILFRNIDELSQYITVDISTDIDTIAPYLKQGEKYIREITGDALFDSLLSAYVAGSLSPEQEEILPLVQLPLANFGYWLAVAKLNVNVGNTGFTVTVGTNLEPASQWRVDQFRESVKNAAYDALEELLKFLEENSSDYQEWTSSLAYSYSKKFFLNNAREYNTITEFGISRLEFLELKKHIVLAEEQIREAICDELYEEIKAQMLSDTVSAENKALLRYIRPAVAYTAYGMWKDISIYILQGEKYLERLRRYLQDNAETYPLYLNSSCYTLEGLPKTYNSPDDGIILSGAW